MKIEVFALIVSIFSLGVSILAFIKNNSASSKANQLNSVANELSKAQNDLAKGQVEMQIREMISLAKNRYADLAILLSKDRENSTLEMSVSAALEDVSNAYDEACAKYIDGKVDKIRFKKLYIHEIRNWVENNTTKNKYIMPQSKFHATVKVYEEWNNLEQ